MKKLDLRIPGPVPLPEQVLRANAQPMINHRGKDFTARLPVILNRLRPLFGTKENILLPLTGSGTAAMEAAVVNVVSPGDSVLVLVGGSFGDRWLQMCHRFGAKIYAIHYPWGEAADPNLVSEYLKQHPEIKAIFVTHNESSTAVLNDIQALAEARSDSDALIIVDAVSSLGGTPVEMDAWGLDVVVTASQKCLMAPPGLSFICLSSRAREVVSKTESLKYYFDLSLYEQMLESGETPFTPNLSAFFALEESLKLIEEEGLEQIFKRHILLRDMARAGIRALDIPLLVKDEWASPTTTSVAPLGVDVDKIRLMIRDELGVELAGGQGQLAGKYSDRSHGICYSTRYTDLSSRHRNRIQKPGQAVAAAEKTWRFKDESGIV